MKYTHKDPEFPTGLEEGAFSMPSSKNKIILYKDEFRSDHDWHAFLNMLGVKTGEQAGFPGYDTVEFLAKDIKAF